MRLMTTNYATEAATTVTASTSNARFPSSNLKLPFRSKRWRSTSPTTQNVVFDLATTEAIDSIVLLWPLEDGIRLSATAVINIQANATDAWTAPAVDQTLTIDNTYVVASHFFTTNQSYRYWRVTVTDPSNPYGYVELGVVWIGKSLVVPSAQNGFKYSLSDTSKKSETDFGHKYFDEYPTRATVQFSYANIDYTDVQTIENAFRLNGTRKPVLAVLDEAAAVFSKNHFLIYGNFGPSFDLSHVSYNVLNVDGISIEELS